MHDLPFCALCLWLVTEHGGRPVELLDADGDRMTFRNKDGSMRYAPTLEEILEHARKREQTGHGSVQLSDGTLLLMLADTRVHGTLVCARHVAGMFSLEGRDDGRRTR